MFGWSWNPIDWVTSAAGEVLGGVGGAILDEIVGWVEEALAYVAAQVAAMVTELSSPRFASAAFEQLAGSFKWLALVTVLATIFAAVGGALINPRVELTVVLREVPVTLVMIGGWYTAAAMWFELCRALTAALIGDALLASMHEGLRLDPSIASFFRLLVALLMIVFLLVFMVEMFVLQHILTLAAILGPLSIALRPWPALKEVSSRMLRNVATLTITPALTCASMSLAVRSVNDAGALGVGQAIGGLAGMVVSVLMPFLVGRLVPLGGSGDSGGRSLIGAAAGVAATSAAVLGGGAVAAGGLAGHLAGGPASGGVGPAGSGGGVPSGGFTPTTPGGSGAVGQMAGRTAGGGGGGQGGLAGSLSGSSPRTAGSRPPAGTPEPAVGEARAGTPVQQAAGGDRRVVAAAGVAGTLLADPSGEPADVQAGG